MMQEEKQLLLQDLCARLPYGVKLNIKGQDGPKLYNFDEDLYTIWIDGKFSINDRGEGDEDGICEIKPYLRPMSSMTEEERKEVSALLNYEFYIDNDYALVAEDDRHRVRLDLIQTYTDYLNKKMFAYRTLDDKNMFELGLALEAPERMYK